MGKARNIEGQRFGKLVALHEIEERSRDNRRQWLCKCDCGGDKLVTVHQLTSGSISSCGCLKKELARKQRLTELNLNRALTETFNFRAKDWRGKKVGMLTVIGLSNNSINGKHVWKCICDCGKEIEMTSQRLAAGEKKKKALNCGCQISCRQDITNQRFGKLVALRSVPVRGGNGKISYKWDCICDCGATRRVNITYLINGSVTSCGCERRSHYEIDGLKFGCLSVVDKVDENSNNSKTRWKCLCSCGNEIVATALSLVRGYVKSCGCKNSNNDEDDSTDWVVYKHTNLINGKVYIGKTCKKPEYRWNDGKGYFYQKHFYNAIQKYGWDTGFTHEIVATGLNAENAKQLEIELIAKYESDNPKKGYNKTAGGEGMLGWHHTDESRAKIIQSNRTRVVSEETKRKQRESHKNQWINGDNPFKGREHTKETKDKITMARLKKHGDITKTHPELLCEWDWEKNSEDPSTYTFGSPQMVWWKCSMCGISFEQKICVKTKKKKYMFGCNSCKQKLLCKDPERIKKMKKTCKENGCSVGNRNAMYGKHGKDNHNSKAVLQFTINGEFIKEHESAMNAKFETGVNNGSIGACCNGKKESAGGYVWKWKQPK